MADLHPDSERDGGAGAPGPSRDSTDATPRWVVAFGIVAGALILLFVALHLAGGGFRGHMAHLRP